METCDNCGRELHFTGNVRVIVCCSIRYVLRFPTEEERRQAADRWNQAADRYTKEPDKNRRK